MKRIILLAIIAMVAVMSYSQRVEIGGVLYELVNGNVECHSMRYSNETRVNYAILPEVVINGTKYLLQSLVNMAF